VLHARAVILGHSNPILAPALPPRSFGEIGSSDGQWPVHLGKPCEHRTPHRHRRTTGTIGNRHRTQPTANWKSSLPTFCYVCCAMCAVCLAFLPFALFLKKVPRSAAPGPRPRPQAPTPTASLLPTAKMGHGKRKVKRAKSSRCRARAIGPTCFVPQLCIVVPVVRVPRGVPQKQIHHLVFALSYSH
jgi:hypothetical protein